MQALQHTTVGYKLSATQQGRRIIFFTILQLVFYFYIIDY